MPDQKIGHGRAFGKADVLTPAAQGLGRLGRRVGALGQPGQVGLDFAVPVPGGLDPAAEPFAENQLAEVGQARRREAVLFQQAVDVCERGLGERVDLLLIVLQIGRKGGLGLFEQVQVLLDVGLELAHVAGAAQYGSQGAAGSFEPLHPRPVFGQGLFVGQARKLRLPAPALGLEPLIQVGGLLQGHQGLFGQDSGHVRLLQRGHADRSAHPLQGRQGVVGQAGCLPLRPFFGQFGHLARSLARRVEPQPLQGHFVDDYLSPDQLPRVQVHPDAPDLDDVAHGFIRVGDGQAPQFKAGGKQGEVGLGQLYPGTDGARAHNLDGPAHRRVHQQHPHQPDQCHHGQKGDQSLPTDPSGHDRPPFQPDTVW